MNRLLPIFLAGLILSCGSKPKYTVLIKDAETEYYQRNDPTAASRKLIEYVNEENEDQLLFMMEAGMLLHSAHQYEKSNKILLIADKKADAMAKSVTGEIGSYLTNERGKPYRGEDFERVNLNMILGINFLRLKEFESALVEFRKVTYKLDVIKKKTRRMYKMNLMAKYLASVAASAADEADFGYVELKQIDKLEPKLPIVGHDLILTSARLGYEDDVSRWRGRFRGIKLPTTSQKKLKKYSQVVLAYEAGKAPVKISRGHLIDEPGMQVALRAAIDVAIIAQSTAGVTVALAMAIVATAEHPIPRYKRRRTSVNKVQLSLTPKGGAEGKESSISTIMLENVEKTMISNYQDHYASVRNKMIKRIAIKAVAAVAAQILAERAAKELKASGGVAALIGFAAGAAVGIATMSAEKPDLRCWHTLPANFQAATGLVKPGTYDAKIAYYKKGGSLMLEEPTEPIVILPNQPYVHLVRTVN